MRLRRIAHAGGILFIFFLPLVCLCQLVPQQEGAAGPYLLLVPHAHIQAGPGLTDDQLAELAAATGQSVSVTDDGEVLIGYDDPVAVQDPTACRLRGHTPHELAQNPVLSATIPWPALSAPPVVAYPLPAAAPAAVASPDLPPPTRPPRSA